MLDELLTPDRFELVEQACAQLCALLDGLPVETDANDDGMIRHAVQRGLDLARAALAALDDDVVNVDTLRKLINGLPD